MSEMPAASAHRVQAAVRDAVSAFRAQARTGPVTEQATDDILFRGAHEIMQALAQHPRDTRALLWPATVRLMLATFLGEVARAESAHDKTNTDITRRPRIANTSTLRRRPPRP